MTTLTGLALKRAFEDKGWTAPRDPYTCLCMKLDLTKWEIVHRNDLVNDARNTTELGYWNWSFAEIRPLFGRPLAPTDCAVRRIKAWHET